ncbi:MAG: hypothetical protein HY935_01225, partial [Nitrosomonadales bacterium]|nr:hypothetical protein [Nitrosomonadales bacterium]
MMNKKYLVAAILAIGISANAFADEKQQEIGINGNYINQVSPSGGTDTLLVFGHYGRYFKPQILGTVNVMVMNTGSNSNIFGAGVGGKYYFKVGQKGDFVPFVDADVMVITLKVAGTSTTPFQISAGGGASYFLTETASVDGRASIQFQSASGNTSTLFNVVVGLTQ